MKRHVAHLLVVVLLALLVLSGQHVALRERLLDGRFNLLTRPATGTVAMVEIDPRSIAGIGVWPWPRSVHAQLIGQIDKAGATAIVFDVDFSSASTPTEDAAFAKALADAGGSVVLPAFRQRVVDRGDGETFHVNLPLPPFLAHSWLGLVNVRPDPDGIIRRYSFGALIDGSFQPSVGALLAGRHDPATQDFRIDFGIRDDSVPTVSAVDVLRGDLAAMAAIKGKHVMVSGTAAELGDRFNVPNGKIIPGSLVQVLAAESILQQRALALTSWHATLIALTGMLGLMALLWSRTRAGVRVLVLAALAVGMEAGALAVQAAFPIVIDTSLPLAAAAIYAVVAALDEIDMRGLLTRAAERRFERVAMSLSDGLICADPNGAITLWNAGASAIFGYRPEEAAGMAFERLLAPGQDFELAGVGLARRQEPGGMLVELVGQRRDGELFDLECSLSAWEATDAIQYGVVLRDISQRKRQQQRIEYLAARDTVTGLANRNSLISSLESLRYREAATLSGKALLLLSVNRLQQISDLQGHSFADRLIVEIADRLVRRVGEHGCVARLDGDEFAVLVDDDPDVVRLGQRLIAAFQAEPIVIGETAQRIGIAVGFACARDAAGAEELLGNAHFALAAAKALPIAAPARFEPGMRGALEVRHHLEAALRDALTRGEFELFYQPQIALASREVVGAEALIRWRHPQRGYVSPGEFMPIVNASSLSDGVAAWVLKTGCRQAAQWQKAGHGIRVGVNLSQSQFVAGDLAGDVEALLKETGLDPALLELEVTEDIILDNVEKTQRMLNAIRDLRVSVAFDDFGTGYGSLTYLKAFPVDKIKIDQTFVRELSGGTADAAIVEATIGLSRALGLSVIAEGIETEAAARLLIEMGCKEGQGYHFGKPMAAADFEARFFKAEAKARRVA